MSSWLFIFSTSCFLVLVESQFYTQKRHYINEIQCLLRNNTKVNARTIHGLVTCGMYYRVARVVVSTDIHFHCSDDLYACTTVGVSEIHKGCYGKMSIPKNSVCKISEQMRYLPCNSDEFQCKKSGLCIKRRLVWNQYNECSTVGIVDTSDEEKPLESCDENTEFRCNTSRTCIPREYVMDFFPQCRDASDERRNAVNWLTCDPRTEYRCVATGRCILRHRVKDYYADCYSASDERGPKLTCFNDTEFDCGPNDRCIPRAWVGNGKFDCVSERDENVTSMECVGDEFGCLDKSRCLPRKYLCDGKQHCADGSDETSLCDHPRLFTCLNDTSIKIPWSATFIADSEAWSCPDGSHLNTKRLLGFKCAVEYKVSGERKSTAERKLIPQFHLHHNISVCADHSDQCFAVDGQFTCARCLEGTTIIAHSQMCDGFVDCPDLSDECSCEESQAEPLCQLVYAEKEDESLDISLICDGKVDYGDGLDEEFCDIGNLTATTNSNSSEEHYECHSRNGSTSDVISQDSFCDGGTDCASGEDECSRRCASNKLGKFLHKDQSSDFLERCYNTTLVSNDSCRNFVRYSVEAHRTKLYYMDEFATAVKACYDEIDRLCYNHPDACPWRFRCGSGGQTVEISAVCDYNIDCGDVSDELKCSNTTHFYCRQGNPRFIARGRYMDGIADCEDRSDEFIDNSFSSSYEMIKNVFLKNFIWISSGISIITNIVVFCKHVIKLGKFKDKHIVGFTNTLVIANLALSDFLMGVALLLVAIKTREFSGQYYLHDLEWRTSLTCNLVQILTVISSETSVNMLILLTILRLYGVLNPFKTSDIKYRIWYLLILISWMIAACLAVVPNWNEDFVKAFWVDSSSFFRDQVVRKHVLEKFRSRTDMMIERNGNKFPSNYTNSTTFYPSRDIRTKGNFGYYSSSSVCFPNLFAQSSPEFQLSMTIIMYNASAIALICACYSVIITKATANKEITKNSRREQVKQKNQTLRIRVMIVVLTDLICWFPIIIMAVISYRGYQLPHVVHPISAIVLVPINSVINPIIYSKLDELVVGFYRKHVGIMIPKRGRNRIKSDMETESENLPMTSQKSRSKKTTSASNHSNA